MTAAPGRLVFVSGQTACDHKGRPVGGDDVVVQAGAALENLGTALAAAGAGPGDVTMLRLYIVGIRPRSLPRRVCGLRSSSPESNRPRARGRSPGAVSPDFLIEIEAMAVVPERR